MLTHVFGRPRRRACMHCGQRRWVRMCRFQRQSTTKFQTVYFGVSVIVADGYQWGMGVTVLVCRRCRDRFEPVDIFPVIDARPPRIPDYR